MRDVFIRDKGKKQPGFSVGVMLNRKETKGELGVEIEVEGNKFPKPEGMAGSHQPVKMEDMKYWSYVHDGSLRGKDNAEYILSKPVMFDEFPGAVTELFAGLVKYGSKIDDSNRTSVHVHLNCQEFHLNRLTAFIALYFTFEEVLTAWCGEHRVGNLFCLRAKDAPAIVSQIKRFIQTDGQFQLQDHLHYAGLNANALHKFGSVEIRSLRGCTDPQVILDWVGILRRIYELSAEFSDPRDICGRFSQEGPLSFFDNVLGGMAGVVRQGITMDNDEIRDTMYTGIRMAQDLCYCRDWEVFNPVSLKSDPFGRDPRRIMKAMTAAASSASSAPMAAPVEYYAEDEEDYDIEPDYDDSPSMAPSAGWASPPISLAQASVTSSHPPGYFASLLGANPLSLD
jgi:hypothetical protein